MASVNGARRPDELNKHDVIRTSATTSFAWRLRCCGVVYGTGGSFRTHDGERKICANILWGSLVIIERSLNLLKITFLM